MAIPNDNFTDGVRGSKWSPVGAGGVEGGGVLTLTPPAGGAWVGERWADGHPLDLAGVTFRVLNPNVGALDDSEYGVRVTDPVSGYYLLAYGCTDWTSKLELYDAADTLLQGISALVGNDADYTYFKLYYVASGTPNILLALADTSAFGFTQRWVQIASAGAINATFAANFNFGGALVWDWLARRGVGGGAQVVQVDDVGGGTSDGGGAAPAAPSIALSRTAETVTVAHDATSFPALAAVAISNGGTGGDAALTGLAVAESGTGAAQAAGALSATTAPATLDVTSADVAAMPAGTTRSVVYTVSATAPGLTGGAVTFTLTIVKAAAPASPGSRTFEVVLRAVGTLAPIPGARVVVTSTAPDRLTVTQSAPTTDANGAVQVTATAGTEVGLAAVVVQVDDPAYEQQGVAIAPFNVVP